MADGWAAVAEKLRDVSGGGTPAFLVMEVENPDTHGHDVVVDKDGTVAPLVPPLLGGRVRRRPVDLDADPVVLVEIVQVAITATAAYASLSPCGRQAVRPFDAPDITKFKEGQRTLVRFAERELDVPAPAEFRPCV